VPILSEQDLVAECSERELEELLGSSVDPAKTPAERAQQRLTRLDEALQAGDDFLLLYLPSNSTEAPQRANVTRFAIRFCAAEAVYWLRCTTKTRSVGPADIEMSDQRHQRMEDAANRGKLLFVDDDPERRGRPALVEWGSRREQLGGMRLV